MVEVDKAIKGGDFDKILVTTTLDGIRIEPLYTATDIAVESDESGFPGFAPLTRGGQIIPRAAGAWDIRGSIAHPDIKVANAQALSELRNGATSLELHLDLSGEGGGVSVRSVEDVPARSPRLLRHGLARCSRPAMPLACWHRAAWAWTPWAPWLLRGCCRRVRQR